MTRLALATLGAVVGFCVSAPADARADATVCATVVECLSRARQMTHTDGGISPEQDQIADRLHDLYRTSIEPLLVLLDDPDEGMRDFAGYALRDMPGLAAQHLPRLARAMEEDPGWLPLAIARIGTPEAIRLLIDTLRHVRDGERDQLEIALQESGPRAFPELLVLFNCDGTCDESLLRSVGTILQRQHERATDAVAPLMTVAEDSGAPIVSRRCAIEALGGLRAVADPAVDMLLTVAQRGPAGLRSAARNALLHIGGPAATTALVSALESPAAGRYRSAPGFDRTLVLRDLAELGQRGAGAGPAVEKRLGDADPDVRVAAARTLGFIGRPESIPALIRALEGDDDVRLAYVVVESLGRLGAVEAMPMLDRIAREHWYRPVRAAAATAARAAARQHSYAGKFGRDNFSLEYFDYEYMPGEAPCATRGHDAQPDASIDGRLAPSMADVLAYEREQLSYDGRGEHMTRRRIVPQVGVRVASGWLVGTDNGEFGGELVFKGDDGTSVLLLQQNVEGIHRMPDDRIVAVTGLGSAALHLIDCDRRPCRVTRWKRLPAVPSDSWQTSNGELMVNTSAGSIVVSAEGVLRMADCH